MPLASIDIATYRMRPPAAPTPPLILLTNERELASLPMPLRMACDQIWLGCGTAVPTAGSCGWLLWRRGERLLQGTGAQIRFAFSVAARRYFVPVHYAQAGDLERTGLDLIGVEPRWFSAAAENGREDSLDIRVRIAAAPHGASVPELSESGPEPWQQLAAALRRENAQPGSSIPLLAQLAQGAGLHRLLQALCLRNLAVALLRQQDWGSAQVLLQQARQLHPEYRELDYLAAQLALAQGRGSEAIAHLQRAAAAAGGASEPQYVGSGGESGYRAHFLLALLAEQAGHQPVALHHFLTGARQRPAFPPALAGVLRQRLTPGMFAGVQWELGRLARSEPQYQQPVFDFFLLHRAWEGARRLLATWLVTPETQTDLEDRLARLAPLWRPSPRPQGAPIGIALGGPFLVHSSVARINRYLAAALRSDPNFDVALDPNVAGMESAASFPGHAAWADGLARLPRRLDLTVRHGWPPDFEAPPTGKLALILPWEFGAIPRAWTRRLEQVDQVWVPSQFVRGVLLRAGVEAARIAVIPNGVDLELYRPEGERARPEGARGVCFLFVGGAIRRKGMDLLLRAWREAFSAGDEASLVIKDLGAKSFYRHLSLASEIETLARDGGAAPVIYLPEEWSEARLPALYRGSDVVVLPYRGEGFGMPLAEGLACGKPVIATAAGPAPEFCPREASWLIAAEETEMPRELRPPGTMSGPVTWFEPSLDALITALRSAYREASEGGLERRGALGALQIRRTHGWEVVTRQYRQQMAALVRREGTA